MTDTQIHPGFDDDTSREARRARFAALRRLTSLQEQALMDDLTRLVRSIAWEGLRRCHPMATEAELDALFAGLVLIRGRAHLPPHHRI